MIIRAALHGDIDDVVEMGARMHAESAYSFLPFDREKVRRLFLSYVTDRNTYGGFVAEDAGKLAGMIGGFISGYFFCDEKVACDMVLFVYPEYRGGRTAVRLIKAFQEWAVREGAREMCLGLSTNVNVEGAGRLYEAMGLTRVGALYKLRLDGAPG